MVAASFFCQTSRCSWPCPETGFFASFCKNYVFVLFFVRPCILILVPDWIKKFSTPSAGSPAFCLLQFLLLLGVIPLYSRWIYQVSSPHADLRCISSTTSTRRGIRSTPRSVYQPALKFLWMANDFGCYLLGSVTLGIFVLALQESPLGVPTQYAHPGTLPLFTGVTFAASVITYLSRYDSWIVFFCWL